MHENTEEKTPYQKYRESGGVINEQDYNSAMERSSNLSQNQRDANKQKKLQAKQMAEYAGFNLDDNDKAIELYGILRGDTKPKDVKDYHSQMSEQSLFVEMLRMSGNMDAANKMIEANHKPSAKTWCPICLKVPAPGEGCR